MRKFATVLALAIIFSPAAASAQGIGVGAKIGTLGYGVDAGLALNSMLTVRGGLALSPESNFLTDLIPSDDIDGLDYSILAPTTTLMAGVDLHLIGPLKLMGGFIYRSENLRLEAEPTGSYEIGNVTYTESGTITAELDQGSLIPYFGFGFGRLVGSGLGIFMDLAFAYSGDSEIVMTASDNLNAIPGFTTELQREADQFSDDAGIVKNFYPILQIGLRFGLGG